MTKDLSSLVDLALTSPVTCSTTQWQSRNFPDSYPDDSAEAHIIQLILDEIHAAENLQPLHLLIPIDTRAKTVAQGFLKDPSQRLSLKEWAGVCGASERTLARLFTAETGMSYGKWQQQARILHALKILAGGGSVTAAALEVGFKSTSSFITMFRNTMGYTPAQYFHSHQNVEGDDNSG